MDIIENIQKTIERENLLNTKQQIIVGLSGGPDSMALLSCLRELGYSCIAVHCNFNLRGKESDRDEAFVRSYCKEKGIKLIVKSFETIKYAQENKESIEMAARNLRYDYFEEVRLRENAQGIAVAHHRDDNVETILLNLIRGTGIRGISGMKYRNNRNIIRPMLDISRDEIMAFLNSRKIPYVIDHTNLEPIVKRNIIRLNVLPLLRSLNPSVEKAIHKMGLYLSEVSSIYKKAIRENFEFFLYKSPLGYAYMNISDLKKNKPYQPLLYEWLSQYGFNSIQLSEILIAINQGNNLSLSAEKYRLYVGLDLLVLDKIDDSIRNWRISIDKDGEYELPNGKVLLIRSRNWVFGKSKIVKSKDFAYFDADIIKYPLELRYVMEGDRFHPYGMKGSQLVSDYLTNKKIAVYDKKYQLILESGKDILWIVGQRTSQKAMITSKTQKVKILSICDR